MIQLTKLNGQAVMVNADLVEMLEETPECLLFLTTGRRLLVREPLATVRAAILAYRRELGRAYPVPAGGPDYSPQDLSES